MAWAELCPSYFRSRLLWHFERTTHISLTRSRRHIHVLLSRNFHIYDQPRLFPWPHHKGARVPISTRSPTRAPAHKNGVIGGMGCTQSLSWSFHHYERKARTHKDYVEAPKAPAEVCGVLGFPDDALFRFLHWQSQA